jgi:hypothetical protein
MKKAMIRGQLELLVDGGEVAELDAAARQLRDKGAASIMILACECDYWRPETLELWLKSLDFPVFGGIFPSIIHSARHHRRGTLLVGFRSSLDVGVVQRLSDRSGLESQLQSHATILDGAQSLITLVDGLSSNLEAFVECLYGMVGVRAAVVGAGAGHIDLVQRPCLLSNSGLLEDAALLVALPFGLDHATAHGWQELSGPYLVTRSHGNVLEELNYRAAVEVYHEDVEAHSGLVFSGANHFTISKTYPLGIESVDGEFLVRDPIKEESGSLICVGEVPENATVYLLKGHPNALMATAGDAAGSARAERRQRVGEISAEPYFALLFDCMSRVLFLGDAFDDELRAVESNLADAQGIVGALTIGEIASSRGGLIELMNKSTVVSLIEATPGS